MELGNLSDMTKISDITELDRHRRLDGSLDLLLQVAVTGEVRYLGVREAEGQLVGAFEEVIRAKKAGKLERQDPDRSIYKLFTVPRRRTRAASLADFINARPSILRTERHQANQDFWALSKDDRDLRDREIRRKREWRIHEAARFVDGRFVARLSCSADERLVHSPTQYVVERSRFDRDRVTVRSQYLNSSLAIDPEALWRAVERQSTWTLPMLLEDVAQGYRFERDAIAAFEGSVQYEKIEKRLDFDVANAVRQPGADRETEITVVDHYV